MLKPGDDGVGFSLAACGGGGEVAVSFGSGLRLIVFFETDCPSCRLALPYLQRLADALEGHGFQVIGVSQDPALATAAFRSQMRIAFPVGLDEKLEVSRIFDPVSVPGIFLVSRDGIVLHSSDGFSKSDLREVARISFEKCGLQQTEIVSAHDGFPEAKPGCVSRHLVGIDDHEPDVATGLYSRRGEFATRIEVRDDPTDYCRGFDHLPVIPPTESRVKEMVAASGLAGDEMIAMIPPNYGAATVEKIAANAVMAGCLPDYMEVLIPLVRAACDERFNLHGVQATTHFAAPLIILNGPVRDRLGFLSGSNVFSNAARANSTVGRAFQLILANLGGARPGEIDMSTLGNPGKFSYCIAENEAVSPWEPFHTDLGFSTDQSALTLFAAEPPRGISEHYARDGRELLRVIGYTLCTAWSTRVCGMIEAFVIMCPEHARTLHREGFTKKDVRDFLYENTCIPARVYAEGDGGEGTQLVSMYEKILVNGEPCYRKFARPEQIKIIVAGGTAGKFSAVIGSWLTGPRGSQMVTFPI